MLKLILCIWDSMLFIYCSIPSVNICMPTSVDHYVTTNSPKAGWIAQLVMLTLDFQGSERSVSHLLVKSAIIPLCWQWVITPDTGSLSPTGFQRKSADEHQTFCAIFDLRIKVIDAEFYGMEEVRCMEYLLRLCVALPVRIWMSHYTPPPSVQLQLRTDAPRSRPWHLSSCPVRGDKPQLWLPSSRVHTLTFKLKCKNTSK